MNKEVSSMLEIMYELFLRKFKDELKAWDHYIEFIAVDNQGSLFFELPHKFEWLFEDQDFCKTVLEIYDSKLLRSDYYDHLGELYSKRVLKQPDNLLTNQQADKIILNYLDKTDKKIKVLIPNCQTGRLILSAKEVAENAIIYAIESDIRLYRIALTNMIIHNIEGYIACYNKSDINIDDLIKVSKDNWKYSNSWNIPSTKPKYKIERQTTLVPKHTFPNDMIVIDSGGLT